MSDYELLEDNTQSTEPSMSNELKIDLKNTVKAIDLLDTHLSNDDDVSTMDIASKSRFLSVVPPNDYVSDLKSKRQYTDDDDLILSNLKDTDKGYKAKAIDYMNAEINVMQDESIVSLIQNNNVEKNRINKYTEIDNLVNQVSDLAVIVDMYTNAIINGDRDRSFPLGLEGDINKDDDKVVKATKILDKIIVDHSLNDKIAKVIEDTVKYGDGFLLVSQISDFMIKTLSASNKELLNGDLFDDLTNSGSSIGGAGYKRMRNKGKIISEQQKIVANEGIYILNEKHKINVTNEDITDLKNYLTFLNTSLVSTPKNPKGIKVTSLTLPNNEQFLQETIEYYSQRNVIQYGGTMNDYYMDAGLSIVSEEDDYTPYSFDNIFTEKQEFDKSKYVNRILTEASHINRNDTDAKREILKTMAKRSKRLKGSIIRRLSPYSVIKLMTGDNFCMGYIYIKQENNVNDNNTDYKYTKNQKGTYGALGGIPTNSLNVMGSPSEGSPINDFGVGAASTNNYLMRNQNDNSTLGKITKTISKILLSTIGNLPDGINKLDDETFISIYKMIDLKKTNKLYFFRPEDIAHIMIDENDDGYGDGLIGTSLVNIAKISLLLDRIKINNQIEKIPQKDIRFLMPDGGNPTDLITGARKLLSKTALITAANTGNVTNIDSQINSYGVRVSPIVNNDTALYEINDRPSLATDLDQDFIDDVQNRLRRLSGVPLSAFDPNTDGDAPKVVTLLMNEMTFAKRIDTNQKAISPALSDIVKKAMINDLLTYNQLVDIDKYMKKSVKKDVKNDEKELDEKNNTLKKALSPLKNDLKNISSDNISSNEDYINPYDDEKYIQSQLKDDKKDKKKIEDKMEKEDDDTVTETNDLSDSEFIELVHKITTLNFVLQSPITMKFSTFNKMYDTISTGAAAMASAKYPEAFDGKLFKYKVTGDPEAEDGDKLDINATKRELYKAWLIRENLDGDNFKNKISMTDIIDSEFEKYMQEIKATSISQNGADADGMDGGDMSMDDSTGADEPAMPDADDSASDNSEEPGDTNDQQ